MHVISYHETQHLSYLMHEIRQASKLSAYIHDWYFLCVLTRSFFHFCVFLSKCHFMIRIPFNFEHLTISYFVNNRIENIRTFRIIAGIVFFNFTYFKWDCSKYGSTSGRGERQPLERFYSNCPGHDSFGDGD
jgi:hypothetical protein